jgi:hypothetical protein
MAENTKFTIEKNGNISARTTHIDHIAHIDHNHSLLKLAQPQQVTNIKVRRDADGTIHLELQ